MIRHRLVAVTAWAGEMSVGASGGGHSRDRLYGGEDYTIPLVNAIVLEMTDPGEIEGYVMYLQNHPDESDRIRRAARRTARWYTWEAAVRNLLGKLEHQARLQGFLHDIPRCVGHHTPTAQQPDVREAEPDTPSWRRKWDSHLAQLEEAGLVPIGAVAF